MKERELIALLAAGEKPAVELLSLAAVDGVPETCGECVAKPGYSWRVQLDAKMDGPPRIRRTVYLQKTA